MGHCIHLALGFRLSLEKQAERINSSIHWDLRKDMRAGEVYADDEIVYEKGRFTL